MGEFPGLIRGLVAAQHNAQSVPQVTVGQGTGQHQKKTAPA